MKSIIYSVVAIFTLVCLALAQQVPDSVAYDSNPSSFQLRAQTGTNNMVTLAWRGDPNSVGYSVQQSIGPGHYVMVAVVGPNVVSYAATGLLGGVTYFFKVCDGLDRQFCSNEVRVRLPR